ncbi:MAG: NADH-quinone oxidoreductase subunit N, partial [Planctomycetaceae bacterium]
MPTSAFEYEVTRQTLLILVPELLLLVAATVMMTAGPFVRLPRRAWCAAGALALVAALVALFALHDRTTDLYTAVALNDAFSFWARVVFVLSGLVLLALAHDQVDDARAAEFFGTFLMIDAGSMLVAAANEMVFLFVGLELVSIPTYLLLYLPRRDAATQEAATKYFFLSIFSSGLMLFGLTYLYGLTGITNLKALAYLAHSVPNVVPQPQLALIAIVFIMAGLGFRVAAVPFHFYAPDVYQGSPTVVAATLAWIPKAIGFLAIVRTLTPIVAAAGPDSPLGNKAVMIA